MKPDWDDLIQRYQAGLCSREECDLVQEALRRDEGAALLYLRYANLDVALTRRSGAGAEFRFSCEGGDLPKEKAGLSQKIWRVRMSAAAALVVGLLWIAWQSGLRTTRETAPVAEIMETRGARWQGCSLPTEVGSRLHPGVLRLLEGIARVRFVHGAEVTLEGPSDLAVLEAKSCRLLRGSLVAHVPESAYGFSVYTPSATLVDQSSDFTVSTDAEGRGVVRVLRGAVDLCHVSGSPRMRPQAREMVMISPDALRLQTPFEDEPRATHAPVHGSGFVHEITTREGRGEAAYVFEPRSQNNQSSSLLLLKHCLEEGYGRKVLLRFDLGELPDVGSISQARLTLNFAPSGFGYASHGGDARIVVYALTRDDADLWSVPELSWKSQPAFAPSAGRVDESAAVKVGEFTVPRGVQTGSFWMEGSALAQRIKADPNRLLTLIIVRENPIEMDGGLVLGIAGNRHPTLEPPRLSVR